eukprot:2368623-Rhodomonas_salina.1
MIHRKNLAEVSVHARPQKPCWALSEFPPSPVILQEEYNFNFSNSGGGTFIPTAFGLLPRSLLANVPDNCTTGGHSTETTNIMTG